MEYPKKSASSVARRPSSPRAEAEARTRSTQRANTDSEEVPLSLRTTYDARRTTGSKHRVLGEEVSAEVTGPIWKTLLSMSK
jgi:hypothetical protein